MHLSGFDLFAWAASSVGQVVLLVVLFVRRRAWSFPIFTLYFLSQICTTTSAYFIFYRCSLRTFQYFFWSTGLLDQALQLLVLFEVALHVFRPTGVWARDVLKTFIGMTGASVMVALLLTWLAHPIAPRPIQTLVLRSDFFSAALMSELLVVMVALSATVGLPWKTHVARIAQGLGTFSIVSVGIGIAAIVARRGTYHHLSYLRDITYLVCEAFWIVMLWAEAPAPRELPEKMKMQIYSLQRHLEDDLIRIRAWRHN